MSKNCRYDWSIQSVFSIKRVHRRGLSTLFTLTYSQTEWGNTLGPMWGLGVGQSVNAAAQPLVGHTLTEFFGQVSRRLGSATNTSWFY